MSRRGQAGAPLPGRFAGLLRTSGPGAGAGEDPRRASAFSWLTFMLPQNELIPYLKHLRSKDATEANAVGALVSASPITMRSL